MFKKQRNPLISKAAKLLGIMALALLLAGIAAPVKSEAKDSKVIQITSSEYFEYYWKSFDETGDTGNTLKLMTDIRLNKEMTIKKSSNFSITVDLNGHDIYGTADDGDHIFRVPEGTTLTIDDSSVTETTEKKGGRIEIPDKDSSYDTYIWVDEGGTFILNNGRIIGNDNFHVRMFMVKGTFKMNGGMISDNKCGRYAPIHCHGGTIYVDGGKFEMHGGTICNNETNGDGGAVYVDSDVRPFAFEMYGGAIRENAAINGGGVCINNGHAKFYGGEIYNNEAYCEDWEGYDIEAYGNDVYIDTKADEVIFGGTFHAFQGYDSLSSVTYYNGHRPIFSGSVQIKGFEIQGNNPGFTCEDLNTDPEDHAWVGFTEKGRWTDVLSEDTILYKDRTEPSPYNKDDFDQNNDYPRCFYIYRPMKNDDKRFIAINEDHFGVFKGEGPSTDTTVIDSDTNEEVVRDDNGYTVWDAKSRTHTYYTWDPSRNVTLRLNSNPADNPILLSEKTNVIKNENNEVIQTEYYYLVTSSKLIDGKAYTTVEYQKLVVSNPVITFLIYDSEVSAAAQQINPKVGTTITLKAGLADDSNYFERWELIPYRAKDTSWSEDDVSGLYDRELTFKMPRVGGIDAKAHYLPHHSFDAPGVSVYRIEGDDSETKVIHGQKDGTRLKLVAEDPLFREWTIRDAKTWEDITTDVIPDPADRKTNGIEITLPARDIYISFDVETDPDMMINVVSPLAEIHTNGVVLPSSKLGVNILQDQPMTFVLDRKNLEDKVNLVEWYADWIFESAPRERNTFPVTDDREYLTIELSEPNPDISQLAIDAKLELTDDPEALEPEGTIYFDANGGFGEMDSIGRFAGMYALPNCGFTPPDNTQQFKGWTLDSMHTGKDADVITDGYININGDESVTLYAIWKDKAIANCEITFHANGGTGTMEPVQIAEGRYPLPGCSYTAPEGKIFAGWSLSSNEEDVICNASIDVTGDIDLYAIWMDTPIPAPTSCTITFKAGTEGAEGDEAPEDITITALIGQYILPGCIFKVPEGKVFLGWSYKDGGIQIDKTSIDLYDDTILYAVWRDKIPDQEEDPEPPAEHVHTYTDLVVKASCVEKGYTMHICTGCGDTYSSDITNATGHDFGEWETLGEPTCTSRGTQTRVCKTCGHTETKTVKATGHNYEYVDKQDATCNTDGMQAHYKCSNCSAYFDTEKNITTKDALVIKADGHHYGSWKVVDPATCTKQGKYERVCDDCDDTETITIDPIDHQLEFVEKLDATCNADGMKAHYRCTLCGAYFDADKTATTKDALVIKAADHDYGEWETVYDATCAKEGIRQRVCKDCGHIEFDNLDITDHALEFVPEQAATCTADGVKAHYICTLCNRCFDTDKEGIAPETLVIKSDGHLYGSWEVVDPATCTKQGKYERVCEECGDTETITIDPLGHKYEFEEKIDATCKADGMQAHYRCSLCGTYFDTDKNATTKDALVIKATDHNYGEWETVYDSTCAKKGIRQRICKDCGHMEFDNLDITDHVLEFVPEQAATCTVDGVQAHYRCTLCNRCFDTDKEGITPEALVIKAAGHDYQPVKVKADIGVPGYECEKCSICQDVINKKELAALKPAATSITKLRAYKKAFTVKWKKKPYTGYQIRYSLKSSMAKAKTVTIGKAGTAKKKIKKLKSRKKYYVQIRTYKTVSGKKWYSNWSARKAITVK